MSSARSPSLTGRRAAPRRLSRVAAGRIVEVDPLGDPRWDDFVSGHPRATVHHLGAWATILRSCYGYRPRYLALEANGALVGVLPLVSSGRRLSGSRLSSLPTAKAAGPLAGSERQERALLAAALELKRSEGLSALLVRSQSGGLEGGGIRLASTNPTQVLELGRTTDRLLESYRETSMNLYRSIRKAHKSGLAVGEAESDRELRAWYRLYLLTIRRHRNFPRRLRQLREARDRLGARWRLVTVKKDGEVVAGGVFHEIADTVELVYSASDRASLSLRPNHALYWHVITESTDRGRAALDFGVSADSSLRQFKRQWGATPREVCLYRDSSPHDDASPDPASSQRGAAKSNGALATVRARSLARTRRSAADLLAVSPPTVTRALGAIAYRIV